jgi:hypothetical protein
VKSGKGAKAKTGVKRTFTMTGLMPGKYSLLVGYVGDGTLGDVQAKAVKVTVAKVKATVRVTVPSSIGASGRATARVKVSAGSLKPTGKVVVSWGAGKSQSVTAELSAQSKGTVSVRLPKLARGTYRVWASYAGSDVIAKKSSAKATVRVGTPKRSAPTRSGPRSDPPPGPSDAGSLD